MRGKEYKDVINYINDNFRASYGVFFVPNRIREAMLKLLIKALLEI